MQMHTPSFIWADWSFFRDALTEDGREVPAWILEAVDAKLAEWADVL